MPAASTLPKPLPPIASRPQTASRPTSYTFTVESNYPVMLIYTDSKGDQVNRQSVPAPWSEVIATANWGADAHPMLTAGSSSTKGDTTVTCTITDNDTGTVVTTKTAAKAFAAISCSDLGF